MPTKTSQGKWNSRYSDHDVPHTVEYYVKCFIGGMLACAPTHSAVTTLDVIKCNMQANPDKYKSFIRTGKLIFSEEKFRGLVKGFTPTLIGYSFQGFFKFGVNEICKDYYANLIGQDYSKKYRVLVWTLASASAEFIADIFLCPFEMIKVKIQTSPQGTWPLSFIDAFKKMQYEKAKTKFPFGSLVPLWSRQIPYTMIKFVGFEFVVENFYRHIFTKPKNSYSRATQLEITFISGYIAGIACAVVSQPFDNLVSQMGNSKNAGKTFTQMAKEQGLSKLVLRGLGTRILMVGTLTGFQWWIFDSFKTFYGMGTTGGDYAKKK